jgi:hypothetical protein
VASLVGEIMDKKPFIPAHSRPKDGVLTHTYAGIQSRKNKPNLGPRFRGDERR